MTVADLLDIFNNTYGLKHWPNIYEVDHDTFANVCFHIFRHHTTAPQQISVALGSHAGIMFRGVEIVLKVKI